MCENIVRSKSLADLPFEVPEAFEHTCIFELTARVTIRNIVLSIDTRLYKEAAVLAVVPLCTVHVYARAHTIYIYIYTHGGFTCMCEDRSPILLTLPMVDFRTLVLGVEPYIVAGAWNHIYSSWGIWSPVAGWNPMTCVARLVQI